MLRTVHRLHAVPVQKGADMKKHSRADNEAGLLTADKTRDDRLHGRGPSQNSAGNIYTEIIHSLMDKNRRRVSRYYCANSRCGTRFFDAASGYQCPSCGSRGIISEYKHDTALEGDTSKPVIGYLDTIGRLFCTSCTHRHGLTDEVSMVIYHDSDPYSSEQCDVCRTRLNKTPD